jgi:nicotinate-nucleotide adenylyltransferase
MGSDNLVTLHKWKNYEKLLNYNIFVYKRRGFDKNPYPHHKNITLLEFPFLDISATFIRDSIRKGISMQFFMPEPVWKYVEEMNLYKKP